MWNYLSLSILVVSAPFVGMAQPGVSVVSAADYGPIVAPGSIASVFGANFASTHATATLDATGNLPTTLQGTSVAIDGQPAGLFYVSPGQINFLVPKNTAVGKANVVVTSPASSTPAKGIAQVQLNAPAVFTIACLRTDRGAVQNAITSDLEPFQATTQVNPSNDKRTRLSIYGTGFRFTDNTTRNESTPVTSHVTAKIIDANGNIFIAPVEYAGRQSTNFGLDQINVALPPGTENLGLATLQLEVDGLAVRPVTIVLSPKSSAAAMAGTLALTTVAGSGASGAGGDSSLAVLAQLRNPSGIAFDAKHNLYIADSDNHAVRMVNAAGMITTFVGTGVSGYAGDNGPAGSAQLRRPIALAFDSQGNLYVADAGDNRIRKISPAGIITTVAGSGFAGFAGDGGAATSAQLSAPGGVAVNSHGTLFIADTANNRVRRVTADGLISTIAGTGVATTATAQPSAYLAPVSGPTDVTVDATGNVLVADSGNFIIRRIGTDGTISTIAGSGVQGSAGTSCPALQAQFSAPVHITADFSGRLIISDSDRIRVIDANCNIYDAAGSGLAGFADDGGNALRGMFRTPLGVAVDQVGNIFVADSANQRVRKLSSSAVSASLSFRPAVVKGSETVTGYLDLRLPRATSSVVQLSASPALSGLPATLIIPAGQATGVITFTVPEVASQTAVTVTASGSGIDATGTLTQNTGSDSTGGSNSALRLGSLTLGSSSIAAGETTTGTITLTDPAPAGGQPVTLKSDSAAARVASSVIVPAGQTGAQFLVTGNPGSPPATATITASTAGSSLSVALNTTEPAPSATNTGTIAKVTMSGSAVVGGQSAIGTVALAANAPTGGMTVSLGSNTPSVIVPANVTIPQGSSQATFPINTLPVRAPVAGEVTATSANTVTSPITVNPPSSTLATVSQVSLNPATVTAGQSSTGTVTLASPAGADGVSAKVSSSLAGVTVPATIALAPGATTASFPVGTSPNAVGGTGEITVTSANSLSVPITINAGGAGTAGTGTLAGLSITPSAITGGQSATGTVTLATPAGDGGISVGLFSNISAVNVPGSVTIPQGSTSATFQVTTSPVTAAGSGSITATSANSISTPVTVTPAQTVGATPAGLSFSPTSVTGGDSATGTVTLSGPAPAGGATVQLSSNTGSVTVPPSISVAAGQSSATFSASTTPVNSATQATVTASTGGASASGSLTVNPPCPAFVSAGLGTPDSSGKVPLTATTTLNGAAPSNGVTVGLRSGGKDLGVITVPAGQTSGSTNLTLANGIGLIGGAINAVSGSCPLVTGSIN